MIKSLIIETLRKTIMITINNNYDNHLGNNNNVDSINNKRKQIII